MLLNCPVAMLLENVLLMLVPFCCCCSHHVPFVHVSMAVINVECEIPHSMKLPPIEKFAINPLALNLMGGAVCQAVSVHWRHLSCKNI